MAESLSESPVPQGLYNYPIVSVSTTHDWTGGAIDELRLRVVGAVANCQCCFPTPVCGLNSIVKLGLDRWRTAPTANVDVFMGLPRPSMGPFVMMVIGCAVRRVVILFEFGADGKHEGWEPDWSARCWDVRHGEDWRRCSASAMAYFGFLHSRCDTEVILIYDMEAVFLYFF